MATAGGGAAPAGGKFTQGINKDNMLLYKDKIKKIAIDQTKELLIKTEPIKEALQEGWKGIAEEQFEENLDAAVQQTSITLDKLEAALDKLFKKIEDSWDEQDRTVVKPY